MDLSRKKLQQIIEAALLAYGQPMQASKLQTLFVNEESPPNKEEIQAALEDIQSGCHKKGYELKEVSSGYRFQVKQDLAPWINLLWDEKPAKYSRAALETLALIAYRQPITRGDIEDIRGVAVSSHIIRTLMERDWVRIVGHRDVPGRPALYASTRQFLDYFNLRSLEELPTLGEIKDFDEVNKELEFTTDDDEQLSEVSGVALEDQLAAMEPQSAITDEDEIEMLEAILEAKIEVDNVDDDGVKDAVVEESIENTVEQSFEGSEDGGLVEGTRVDDTALDESNVAEEIDIEKADVDVLAQEARLSFADLVQRQMEDNDKVQTTEEPLAETAVVETVVDVMDIVTIEIETETNEEINAAELEAGSSEENSD